MDDHTDLRPDDEGDAKIAGLIRDLYAPPAEGAYWSGLEGRIMAHIARHRSSWIPVNWWTDLAKLDRTRTGSSRAFVRRGVECLVREKDEEMRTAYEAVTNPSDPMCCPAVQVVIAPHDGSSQREADVPLSLVTLRFGMERSKERVDVFCSALCRRWAIGHRRPRHRIRPSTGHDSPRASRQKMAEELELTPPQQASIDSLMGRSAVRS